MNLFDIEKEYLDINELLLINGGELTEEIEELLHINKNELERKVKSYYYIYKQNEANIELLKEEIERLTNKVKAINNTNDRLKERVKEALLIYGEDEIDKKTKEFKNKHLRFLDLHIYNTYKPKIEIDLPELIDDKYKNYTTKYKFSTEDKVKLETLGYKELFENNMATLVPDKELILKDIKETNEVPKAIEYNKDNNFIIWR